jgi:hypothetical protein
MMIKIETMLVGMQWTDQRLCIHRYFPHYYDDESPLYDRRLDFEEVIAEIVFFEGSSYKLVTSCFDEGEDEIQCPRVNYREFTKMVSSTTFIYINIITVVCTSLIMGPGVA